VLTYQVYLAALSRWAGETAVTADELETCIFLARSKAAGTPVADVSKCTDTAKIDNRT